MSSFICCECNKLNYSEVRRYRTFADSSIDINYDRICETCSYSNKINNYIILLIAIIVVGLSVYFSDKKYKN